MAFPVIAKLEPHLSSTSTTALPALAVDGDLADRIRAAGKALALRYRIQPDQAATM